MGWETRGPNGPAYYYRKSRDPNGRVRSTYLGAGPHARLCAELAGVHRAYAAYRVAALRRFEAAVDAADEATRVLTAGVEAALSRALEAQGYRYHRGEWRRPRAGRERAAEAADAPTPDAEATAPARRTPTPERAPAGRGRRAAPAAEEGEYEPPPPPPSDPTSLHAELVRSTTWEAYAFRVHAERALRAGEGDDGHPALVRLRAAAAACGRSWGRAAEASAPEASARAGAGVHDGVAVAAAGAVAAVLEAAGDADGRLAVLARVGAVRDALGWAGADPLGRWAVDQHALAVAHVELVHACAEALRGGEERASEDAPVDSFLEVLERLAGACGVSPVAPPRPGDGDRLAKAWGRRLQRAEAGLRRTARLLRHARKAGVLAREASVSKDAGRMGVDPAGDASDPLAVLAAPKAPPTRPPLRGEAAEVAAETRARIEARRAAWPPPERIRWEELRRPECPWDPLDYGTECDEAGRPVEGGAWAVLEVEPETPEEALADLARWAPEYATP